jgi:hypothetical protein
VFLGDRRSEYQCAGSCQVEYGVTFGPQLRVIDCWYDVQRRPARCTWWKMLSLGLIEPISRGRPLVAAR